MQVITETKNEEGLMSLLGKRVLIMSAVYFYEGKLIGVNDKCVKLSDAHIVYTTGAYEDKDYGNIEKLHTDIWYVSTGLIDSFGLSKKDA